MIAVFVNCAAVFLGSLIGLLFSKRNNDKFSEVVCSAAGIITLIIGLQMALSYKNIVYIALSLILGGLFGAKIDIDEKILTFGHFLEKKFSPKKNTQSAQNQPQKSNFAYAFLNASVLFCVGAMAIVGSFQAGLNGDYTLIFTKSILDGFLSIVFTAAMGIGTVFSIIPILLYQGGLTLASSFAAPFVSEQMLNEITAVGGCLVIMIGINLLNIKKLKTANYLPAILIVVFFVTAEPILKSYL